ncbi:MAG: hypothetical protein WC867_08230 [Candidatus Pacearchaeota archaeon]|jgi:hypothetical protein
MPLLKKVKNTESGLMGLTSENEWVGLKNPIPKVYGYSENTDELTILERKAESDKKYFYQLGRKRDIVWGLSSMFYIHYITYLKR